MRKGFMFYGVGQYTYPRDSLQGLLIGRFSVQKTAEVVIEPWRIAGLPLTGGSRAKAPLRAMGRRSEDSEDFQAYAGETFWCVLLRRVG